MVEYIKISELLEKTAISDGTSPFPFVDLVDGRTSKISKDNLANTLGIAPPGADRQIVFNDGGVFGALSGFEFDKTQEKLFAKKVNFGENFFQVETRNFTNGEGVSVTLDSELTLREVGAGGATGLERAGLYGKIDPINPSDNPVMIYCEVTGNQIDTRGAFTKAVTFGAGDTHYVANRGIGVAFEAALYQSGGRGNLVSWQKFTGDVYNQHADPSNSVGFTALAMFEDLAFPAPTLNFGAFYGTTKNNCHLVEKTPNSIDSDYQFRLFDYQFTRLRWGLQNDGSTTGFANSADAGTPLQPSPRFKLASSFWDGAANVDRFYQSFVLQTAATETGNRWAFFDTNLAEQFNIQHGLVEAVNRIASKQLTLWKKSLTISGGTVDWNLTEGQNAEIVLTEDISFNAPTGLVDGQTYYLAVRQGGVGGYKISWDIIFEFSNGANLNPGLSEETFYSFVYSSFSNKLRAVTTPLPVLAEADQILTTTSAVIPAQNALIVPEVGGWTFISNEQTTGNLTDGSFEYTGEADVLVQIDRVLKIDPDSASAKKLGIREMLIKNTETTVTFDNTTNTVVEPGTILGDGALITFIRSAGTLPAEIETYRNAFYYVVNAAVNSFQISYTMGGAPIAFTDDGTPINSYRPGEFHGSQPTASIARDSEIPLTANSLAVMSTGDQSVPIVTNVDNNSSIRIHTGGYIRGLT